MNKQFANVATPWGKVQITWSDNGIHSCLFEETLDVSDHLENQTKGKQLIQQYIQGQSVQLAPQGTEFQKKVWQTLALIPRSETRSYKWVGEKLGYSHGFQSIGQAVKRNPINLFIPCHRVIKSDGQLGGFRWGKAVKQKLLQFESH